jgi:putative addiction module component (TIGR02574 family)
MARDPLQLLHEALELSVELRAALAGSLLDSLDTAVDEDAENAWRQEIERRLAGLDRDANNVIPWEQVHTRLRAGIKH